MWTVSDNVTETRFGNIFGTMSNTGPANKAWWIPVRSDRGEEYPNAKAAAKAFGKNHGAIQHAIYNNQKCAGRKWEVVKQQSNNSQATVKQQSSSPINKPSSPINE